MTEAQMRELVSATFANNWTATPFVIENEAIALPTSGSFASLTITPTTSAQQTTGRRGTRRWVRNGWIAIKLWSPIDGGTKGAAGLVDAVRDLFEGVSLPSPVPGDDALTTFAVWPSPGVVDGQWFMQLARVQFTWSEHR